MLEFGLVSAELSRRIKSPVRDTLLPYELIFMGPAMPRYSGDAYFTGFDRITNTIKSCTFSVLHELPKLWQVHLLCSVVDHRMRVY